MTAVNEAIVDSVRKLGLNGHAEHTHGVIEDGFKIRNICCVGAGYVGKFELQPMPSGPARLRRQTLPILVDLPVAGNRSLRLGQNTTSVDEEVPSFYLASEERNKTPICFLSDTGSCDF